MKFLILPRMGVESNYVGKHNEELIYGERKQNNDFLGGVRIDQEGVQRTFWG